MAHIEKRQHKLKSGDGRVRTSVTYRARYIGDDGRERSRSFDRKIDAERFLAEQAHRLNSGTWVDPSEGRRTLREVAERWQASQPHRPSTKAQVASHLERHILPVFGDRPLAAIRKSDVQAWVKGRAEVLEPATVETMFRHLSSVFRSAVEDRLIGVSPCAGVKLPRRARELVVPLSVAEVTRLADAIDPRYRGLVLLAAGTGLRQGEAFGLTLDRVDFLRRRVRVDRQLVQVGSGAPAFGPPKTAASVRTVPMADVTLQALARHLEAFPVDRADGLLFTTAEGGALRRNRFAEVWSRARASTGLGADRTFHDLRHFYASLLIRHGESVKVVQARLGHASASETLDTYSHLWPDSDDRTRDAVTAAWAPDERRPVDGQREVRS